MSVISYYIDISVNNCDSQTAQPHLLIWLQQVTRDIFVCHALQMIQSTPWSKMLFSVAEVVMVVVLVVVMQFEEITWALRQHTNACKTPIDDVMLDWITHMQHHRWESFLCSFLQDHYFLGFSQEGNRFDIGTEGPIDEHRATTSGRTANESVVQTCTMV